MTWLVPCSLLSDPILSGVGLLFRCWTTPRKHWRCWRLCYHRLERDWSCTKNHGVKDLDHHNGESFGTVTAATRPWAILGLENPGKESSPSKLDYIKSVTKCALLMAQRKAQGCSSAFKTVLPLWCILTRMHRDHAWIEEETAWSWRPLRACEIGCWMGCHCTRGEQIEWII